MAFPTLATSYDHEILGNEYCSGYTDVFGQWNTGFYCPQTGSSRAVFCCGTSVFKYCCTSRPSSRPMDRPQSHDEGNGSDINALDSTDTLILIAVACGVAAVLILIIVFSCFFCSCCFVYKKRSNVPGMYRMQDSSTTSGLANFHHHHHHHPSSSSGGGVQQSMNISQEALRSSYHQQQHPQSGQQTHFSSFTAISGNYPSRSVLGQQSTSSPTPQEMTCLENMIESSNGLCGGPHESFIGGRSDSLASSNPSPVEMEWSSGGGGRTTPTSLFHINNHRSSGIPSNHPSASLLPPPARFASNQNLSLGHNNGSVGLYSTGSMMIMDKTNPRELLLQKQQNYSGHSGGVVSPYSLVPSHQQQPNSIQRNNYCTSTLPSCLRRSAGTISSGGSLGGNGSGYHPQQTSSPPPLSSFQQELIQPQQPLKSILRNPRNIPLNYSNTPPINNYNVYRRVDPEFEFSEALLPQSGAASSYHGSTSYSERPLLNQIESLRSRPFTPEMTATTTGSTTNLGGRYGTTTTEYQNDLNRLDKELDLDSLNRLIELDLDSKL